MLILRRIDEVRTFSRNCRAAGERVALVPTMGYLHRGHLSLIALARERARRVIVSIFVNPKQFGPSEDFTSYPRDFERDRKMCEEAGADALFAPEASEIYPPGHATRVSVEGPLTARLCGASRPGHFAGVATVVAKLFTICEPGLAVFGQKDAQQAAVIRRMTADLNLPVEILVAPIVREADGLAMSSRNVYLGAEERAQATILHRALSAAEDLVSRGERDGERLLATVQSVLSEAPLARTDYAELVDAQTLEPVSRLERPALLALAVFLGKTRLIDNTLLRPAQGS
jgi:pantoate--beta-alanine ligase